MSAPLCPFPAFPPQAFMGDFAAYQQLVGPTTESPDAFLWGGFAGTLASLIGRDAGVRWGARLIFPNVNIGAIGATALSRKSTAYDDVVEIVALPLRPQATRPGEPEPYIVLDGSGTGEGYVECMCDKAWTPPGAQRSETVTGRRALIVIHELAELLNKARRDQAGNVVEVLLNTFDMRREYGHTTKSRTTKITNGTAIVLAASTVKNLLAALSSSNASAGLLNRIVWLGGDRKSAIPIRPPLDQAQHAHFLQGVRAHLQAVRGREFTLDPAARSYHDARYREHYSRTAGSDMELSATSRADIMALKIAMLLAAASGTTVITEVMAYAAWSVVYCSNHVTRMLVEQIPERTLQEAEDRVRAKAEEVAVAQGGQFRERDVFQRLKGRSGMPAEVFKRAFRTLLSVGDIVPCDDADGVFEMAEDDVASGAMPAAPAGQNGAAVRTQEPFYPGRGTSGP
jgi:hypothetical protein